MSDPKRATLITVGATKSEKNKVNKTVRLTINLVESNESKYPELNYKELVIAEERKSKSKLENGRNGKTNEGLHPFSDNDDDVERVARKFEQKYGGKSTYGRKGRSKHDDFADIGAGYDENDSFIDNTDGYDEMIPPECDTLYGGFYINSGSLEFKNVDPPPSDEEVRGRRNKRRISSSSSEEDSSDSSSESEGSHDEKDPKTVNGDASEHNTEHRKKKNKKSDQKKPKKIRRTDSSAATSGKQTSDDHGDGESADSRTSQSDSLTSKPAPSSENPVTSDSSRDAEAKVEPKLPAQVSTVLEELESLISRQQPTASHKDIETVAEPYVVRLERTLSKLNAEKRILSISWTRAARALNVSRTKLLQKREAKIIETLKMLKALIDERKPGMMATYNAECERVQEERKKIQIASAAEGVPASKCDKRLPKRRFPWCPRSRALLGHLVKLSKDPDSAATLLAKRALPLFPQGFVRMPTLLRQADLDNNVLLIVSKKRFPWCPRSRALLGHLVKLSKDPDSAATLLAKRALPLFPQGFVRMPTLLRQADISKDAKVSEVKRQRTGNSTSGTYPPPPTSTQPTPPPTTPGLPSDIHFPAALTVTTMNTSPEKEDKDVGSNDKGLPSDIHFPAALTVTTMNTSPEKEDKDVGANDKDKQTIFGSILNSFTLSKDLVVEKQEDKKKEDKKEDSYIPSNIPGSITITPVVNNQKTDKKVNVPIDKHKSDGLIRVKSPQALNDMVHKQEKKNIHKRDKDKHRKDKHHNHEKHKERRVNSPLHIDTSYQSKKEPTPSPKTKDEIRQRQIDNLRLDESNIPRPALIPVHLSPTFAKPDKRPPEKKKNNALPASDLDTKKKDVLIVSDMDPLSDNLDSVVAVDDSSSDIELKEEMDEATKEDFDSVMKSLRDLEHSREAPFNSSSYSGVITSAKRDKSSSELHPRGSIIAGPRTDKLVEPRQVSDQAPPPL
ncbi:HPC2 and ubinuclein domain-containing protein [Phthorimaea operculella]|nr:HPC2 and ubinuclein domain-containing protein [Phthorimaea operculella]